MVSRGQRRKREQFNRTHHVGIYNGAEAAVKKVCDQWKEQKKILHYIHSKPSRQLDQEGIDFIVILKCGLAVLLQVKFKTSEGQIKEKIERHFEMYPHVKSLVVVDSEPTGFPNKDEELYTKVARDVAAEINKLVPEADQIRI